MNTNLKSGELADQLERLNLELLRIIPAFTRGRGSFNSMPPTYEERNPGSWQREFLSILSIGSAEQLKPNNADIGGLARLLNLWSLTLPTNWRYEDETDQTILMPTGLLQTIVGYALFEMLVRALLPNNDRLNGLNKLLKRFERDGSIPALGRDLAHLNSVMRSNESDRVRNLYERVERGRNQLMHGNVLRTFEPEGELMVLLVDLCLLHVMRDALSAQADPAR